MATVAVPPGASVRWANARIVAKASVNTDSPGGFMAGNLPPGGRGVERVALSRPQRPLAPPRRVEPGHAPPPPRPFGRVGGNVAVTANRLERGLSHPHPPDRGFTISE
jgi:hypothetical protein